ncbi:MAG: 16S rRNA (cytidine1402-2'-O)-methyltransferase [Parcubacteria group bacterium Greene0714_4]|nr:MAG: 16S rRNA (cytidine1402-2'-O)-methyltransferase [Parcubacteria group bacterium Greene0714_4]
MSTFYVVATPIGNLEDITLRAIRVLKEVDLILCEDTRQTRKLLSAYDIRTPVESYHAQSTRGKAEKILKMLGEGKNLALVSDAGTPTISDPGSLLVEQIYERFGNPPQGEVRVVPIPGANAALAALSVSGIPSSSFLFFGFLPHKKGRETLFKEIAISKRTIVFYESPHRIEKTLAALVAHLKGGTGRTVSIGRELTKKFEEIISGSVEDVATYFLSNSERIKGEFVVIVSGA